MKKAKKKEKKGKKEKAPKHKGKSKKTNGKDPYAAVQHHQEAFPLDLKQMDMTTIAIHGDEGVENVHDVAPPLHVATTFLEGDPGGMVYSRADQPTRKRLEHLLGAMCGGTAVTYASGLAATTALLNSFQPTTVVQFGVGYKGTRDVLRHYVELRGKEQARLVKVDVSEAGSTLTVEELKEMGVGQSHRDMVFTESPTNPCCHLVDVEALASAVHQLNAILVVDSTFATPYLQNPTELGADITLHSCTKFLGGHSDLLCGVAICKELPHALKLWSERTSSGAVPGSLESWLLLRSLRTFPLRLRQQSESAERVARWLADERRKDKIACVHNPCVPSHPSHQLWLRTFCPRKPSASSSTKERRKENGEEEERQSAARAPPCFAFELRTEEQAKALLSSEGGAGLQLFARCTSLGGVESSLDLRHRFDQEMPPTLVRVSIGLEHPDDLIAALEHALEKLPSSS
ncbi:Cystathionine gamma-synthase [Balamuthia mandrillaris]